VTSLFSNSFILCLCFMMISCSSTMKGEVLDYHQSSYQWVDKNGDYLYKREHGERKRSEKKRTVREVVTKEQLVDSKNGSLELERVVSISDVGQVAGVTMLRPKSSEHLVWIDDVKKKTRLDIDVENRVMVVKSSDTGEERVPFPKNNGAFCFINQIAECAAISGFLAKAIEEEGGEMNITVLFTAYPYMKDLYPEAGNELFAQGVLTYEQAVSKELYRLTLDVIGQLMSYIVTKKGEVKEYYWSAQGISVKTGRGHVETPKLDE